MNITDDCMGCGECVEICPVEAIQPKGNYQYFIDTRVCINCKSCTEIDCPGEAIKE
jgi:ferredoxin